MVVYRQLANLVGVELAFASPVHDPVEVTFTLINSFHPLHTVQRFSGNK